MRRLVSCFNFRWRRGWWTWWSGVRCVQGPGLGPLLGGRQTQVHGYYEPGTL